MGMPISVEIVDETDEIFLIKFLVILKQLTNGLAHLKKQAKFA